MKPISIDITPLAKALQMPAPTTTQSPPAKAEARAETSAKTDVRKAADRAGVYPAQLTGVRGWSGTLAQEQIHALATHVLARHVEQGMRTVAITSALAGEGKTTVTFALAEKLGGAGKKILVIDLDTHRATLSQAANLEGVPGALEAAEPQSNGSANPFHTYPTDRRGVSIMPSGIGDGSNGVPLLSPERLARIVKRALDSFDLVILDCPPLLPVADTHVIGDVADSAILVVRANSTPQPILTQALSEFGREKFFAAVLNRARSYNIPYFREVYGYYRRDKGRPGR